MAAAVLLAVVVLGTGGPAQALPILEPEDAEQLAADLAEASAVHDICYGWRITVDDQELSSTGVDVGSSRGVGRDAEDSGCARWMTFAAYLTYTPSSSESEDSASFGVWSNLPRAPGEDDLRRIGITSDALLGDADDLAVINGTLALPALSAEMGLAPALPLERNVDQIHPADHPTGTPGSDWTRSYGHFVVLSVFAMVGGLAWALWAWAAGRYGWKKEGGE